MSKGGSWGSRLLVKAHEEKRSTVVPVLLPDRIYAWQVCMTGINTFVLSSNSIMS